MKARRKQSKHHASFPEIVNVHHMVMKFRSKLSNGRLTPEELVKAHENYDLLKFSDYEDAVHYKVLAKDMHTLRVFPHLENAIQFCERLIPGSQLISFEDLFNATKCEDIAVRDVIMGYLRLLAKVSTTDRNVQPLSSCEISFPEINNSTENKKTTGPLRLFAPKSNGPELRLSLVPRQKQAIVRQESDHMNTSIRARPKPRIRKTEAFVETPSHRSEVSISSRIKFGLQRAESGYSYREDEGGRLKSSGIKIVSHDCRTVSNFYEDR